MNRALDTEVLQKMRLKILRLCYLAKTGHISSSFSILEALYVLYKDYNKQGYSIILSKGHAALALYAVLEHFGIITSVELNNYCKNNSLLAAHPSSKIKGLEYSAGALGIMPGYIVGAELANKIDKIQHKSFVIIGDGELNEGSVWETLMFVGQQKMNSVILLVDNNNLQASNYTSEIIDMKNVFRAIEQLGFGLIYTDGHNISEISKAITKSIALDKPSLIILKTTKGKGVSFLENNRDWHHRVPNREEFIIALKELKNYEEE